MAVNIEDAGFEIRDMISWLYGSGFPKSLNIGKQIDKIQGNEREDLGLSKHSQPAKSGHHAGLTDTHINFEEDKERFTPRETKGNSEWEGWGTALKPACEPIVVARKPLSEKNVASNCLKWGTGGINIDGCRVESSDKLARDNTGMKQSPMNMEDGWNNNSMKGLNKGEPTGRFPANIILDEEAGKILDEQSGNIKSGSVNGIYGHKEGFASGSIQQNVKASQGGASRFFYCAKASKSERNMGCEELEEKEMGRNQSSLDGGKMLTGSGNERSNTKKNNHPTVKPIKLMEYLVKLVSKENAKVLDPFMGSGTTGIACKKLNREFIGIEREEDYIKIAEARISSQSVQNKNTAQQNTTNNKDTNIKGNLTAQSNTAYNLNKTSEEEP